MVSQHALEQGRVVAQPGQFSNTTLHVLAKPSHEFDRVRLRGFNHSMFIAAERRDLAPVDHVSMRWVSDRTPYTDERVFAMGRTVTEHPEAGPVRRTTTGILDRRCSTSPAEVPDCGPLADGEPEPPVGAADHCMIRTVSRTGEQGAR